MSLTTRCCFVALIASLGTIPNSFAEESGAQVLLLTKSQAFQHQTIAEEDGADSQVEIVLREMLAEHGMTLTATKDAGSINAENLKSYQLIIFYTQGDLRDVGLDGHPAMGPDGVRALTEWIKSGGGFMGFHSATDTLRENGTELGTPYTKLIGAAFYTHGQQFRGTLRAVDKRHPTMKHLPDGFTIRDEWYVFQQMNKDAIHVLALLELGKTRARQEKYDLDPYPVVWCRALGEGRIYYSAMGHRPDVWENETFLSSVDDAVMWALGEGPTRAKPNYADVVRSGTDD